MSGGYTDNSMHDLHVGVPEAAVMSIAPQERDARATAFWSAARIAALDVFLRHAHDPKESKAAILAALQNVAPLHCKSRAVAHWHANDRL